MLYDPFKCSFILLYHYKTFLRKIIAIVFEVGSSTPRTSCSDGEEKQADEEGLYHGTTVLMVLLACPLCWSQQKSTFVGVVADKSVALQLTYSWTWDWDPSPTVEG
uniref:Secreted protein n=1 Tax=Steinernema glaseri TaxID=37863 RepID=A0A1I8AKG5_9BILA